MDGINWKDVLETELRRHTGRRQAIRSLRQEITELEEDYGRLRAAQTDRLPVQGGGTRMEDRLITNMMLRDKLAIRLKDTYQRWNRIEQALGLLSPEQQQVIRKMYIERPAGGLPIICEELSIEKSEVYRQKDRAMEALVLGLYGEE
jgi:hypothetical protein